MPSAPIDNIWILKCATSSKTCLWISYTSNIFSLLFGIIPSTNGGTLGTGTCKIYTRTYLAIALFVG